VLQTILGLVALSHRVVVVADAIGSRDPADKAIAIERPRKRISCHHYQRQRPKHR
jgi:nicotinamidase-related amidase